MLQALCESENMGEIRVELVSILGFTPVFDDSDGNRLSWPEDKDPKGMGKWFWDQAQIGNEFIVTTVLKGEVRVICSISATAT